MKILVGYERSGKIRDAFRRRGHNAVSCDLQDTISPGPHYKGSVFDIIDDGWDLGIFHPPCTHIAVSGAAWFKIKKEDGRQQAGIDLFLRTVNNKIPKWAVENPIGIMSRLYRPYDQLIHPWMFGDPYQKRTCLWLHNLPPLFHWNGDSLFNFTHTHTHPGEFIEGIGKDGKRWRQAKWYADARNLPPVERSNIRSETFPGIAKAMAEQWG